MLKSHKELLAWQGSYELALQVYRIVDTLPSEERFGLATQVRRAAVSVPSNIAEGYHRGSRKDYLRFLGISLGSLAELETQLMLCYDLGYVNDDARWSITHQVERAQQLIKALRRSLRRAERR